MAQGWLTEVRQGGDPGGAKAEARKAPTMEELCKKFMTDYSSKRNKPTTQAGYQAAIDRNIIPMLGRKKVYDVSYCLNRLPRWRLSPSPKCCQFPRS